ncbi:MAG: hypothetical protein QOI78_1065 [Actinomycetota bacterium]|nr:hypothetical protein [Actinomycetota bacterium]
MRFFFDAGSGTVLWADVGPADLEQLPLGAELRAELDSLVDQCRELGEDVEDGFTELHEDPDLDRYLADPKGFKR